MHFFVTSYQKDSENARKGLKMEDIEIWKKLI